MNTTQQLADALRAFLPLDDTMNDYQDADDGLTYRTCCHAVAYRIGLNGYVSQPHAEGCRAVKAAEALAAYDAQQAAAPAGEHTRGPWHFVIADSGNGIVLARGYAVAKCDGPGGIGIDDARRIVACVNACEGLTTEELERLSDGMLNTLVRDTL